MTRAELGSLLEQECFSDAASRIFAGEDVRTVCAEVATQSPHYNDTQARYVLALAKDVASGAYSVES